MNTEDILIWIISNLLTDKQLDTKLPINKTIRQWYAGRMKERK